MIFKCQKLLSREEAEASVLPLWSIMELLEIDAEAEIVKELERLDFSMDQKIYCDWNRCGTGYENFQLTAWCSAKNKENL